MKTMRPGGVMLLLAIIIIAVGSGLLLNPILSLMNWFALHH
jgi:hypothetical protein